MDIDFYSLRIFCRVMDEKTFSGAARSLKITQPTVSQQIGKLEAILNGKLFERVGHDIIPTKLALKFQDFALQTLEQATLFQDHIQNESQVLSGMVRYAMPESCQWTPHFKKIMADIAEVPGLKFQIDIVPNAAIVQGLIEAKYDFGFVVGERLTPELRFHKFSDEHYSAVASDLSLFLPLKKNSELQNLRLITYPGWESFFTAWAKSAGLLEKLKNKIKEPVLHIGSLAGAIHAAQNGAGIAVIPSHCVEGEIKNKTLFAFPLKNNTRASQPIYLSTKIGTKLPRRSEVVLEMLAEAKKVLG